jgi:hypothetical protein
MTLMVVPQAILEIEAGFVEMERWTTWNGPGSLQTPVSPTVEEVMELPEFPTAIKPETADGEPS